MQSLLTKFQIPANSIINEINTSRKMQALLNLPLTPISKQSKAVLLQINNKEELNHFFPIVFDYISSNTIVWIIYPKKSGSIKIDLTRDVGWDILSQFEYRGIRLISINDDYTAVRVKPIHAVKKQVTPTYPEIDLINKKVRLPQAVVKHPSFNTNLEKNFNQLSYTIKKELILGVLNAKKEETRLKRIEKLIYQLEQSMNN